MSAPEFTADGIVIQSYEEIYTELADGLRAIYGLNINLDQDSPDGQRIRAEAKARHDMQQFCLSVANGFDPDFAVGLAFQKLGKLINIYPRPATRSQWDLTVNANRNLTLQSGYTVQDDLGQNWILTAPVNIFSGTNTVTFVAEQFGNVSGDTGASITQQTVVLGVTSITAAVDAVNGLDEETPEQFKLRRSQSTANLGFSVFGKLFAALAAVPGVSGLALYENKTNIDDVVRGIPANTVWAIVEGGNVDDIVEVLTKQRTTGCDTKGLVEGTFVETVPRPVGAPFVINHVMQFDRPQYVPLYIRFNYTRKDIAVPVDVDFIKLQLAALPYVIGQDQQAADLNETALSGGSNYIVTGLEISLDGVAWTGGNLSPGLDGKFTVDVANITATELAP